MKTAALAVVAFVLGLSITFIVVFQVRFLWVAYQHGGLY
ncbi:MAG: hypothetical protein ACI9MC_001803 [Kiritimatiellia bacterium]|jgi:hypothetical protein